MTIRVPILLLHHEPVNEDLSRSEHVNTVQNGEASAEESDIWIQKIFRIKRHQTG
ncbi:hypothetical protein CA11_33340 [Gimesia maris]|nr:hypothetical protein CA11_33340 [Gimesia maris]